MIDSWEIVRYRDIKVFYKPKLHGGGMDFGQDYVPVVKELFGGVNSLCEFASGPGFIGFSLLAHGLCNKLCLVDINPEAVECCNETIRENHLEGKVSVYVSDVFDKVPRSEKWDLVVGNPPFFNTGVYGGKEDLLGTDPGWDIHKRFYRDVAWHLREGSSTLLLEALIASNPKLWEGMAVKNGLHFVKVFQVGKSPFKAVGRLFKLAKAVNMADLKRYFRAYKKHKDPNFLVKSIIGQVYFVWAKKG